MLNFIDSRPGPTFNATIIRTRLLRRAQRRRTVALWLTVLLGVAALFGGIWLMAWLPLAVGEWMK